MSDHIVSIKQRDYGLNKILLFYHDSCVHLCIRLYCSFFFI